MFRLRDCTEDDTIFIGFWSISSELLKHIGVCFQLTVPVDAGAVILIIHRLHRHYNYNQMNKRCQLIVIA